MNEEAFIGIGKNPDGLDIPLGLGMKLSQDSKALNHFSALTQNEREGIITYVQGSTTGDDAKARIGQVVEGLRNGQSAF
ncbi:MAG: hypothetical protein Q8876_09080 [Bacillota bacterium]|nr:hypothetical protein [Bacillota bacterium]